MDDDEAVYWFLRHTCVVSIINVNSWSKHMNGAMSQEENMRIEYETKYKSIYLFISLTVASQTPPSYLRRRIQTKNGNNKVYIIYKYIRHHP